MLFFEPGSKEHQDWYRDHFPDDDEGMEDVAGPCDCWIEIDGICRHGYRTFFDIYFFGF